MSEELARIKPKGNILYAQPLRLREGKKEKDIKNLNVIQYTSKNFKEVFDVPDSKGKLPPVNKWAAFEDSYGIVDVAYMSDVEYAEYCIDSKIGIYKDINKIIKEDGFKFYSKASMKRHVYIVIKELLFLRFSDELIKFAVDYYFYKSSQSFNARKKRFINKAFCNSSIWNYFATFTYDPELFKDENEFTEYMKKYLRRLAYRRKVKYMGAFEKSPVGRTHLHVLMSLPDDYVDLLKIEEEEYYDKRSGTVKSALISQTLKKNIGRCDFKDIYSDSDDFIRVLDYICKYISKQENKILYSRGLRDEIIGKVEDFSKHSIGFTSLMSTFFLMDGSTEYSEI